MSLINTLHTLLKQSLPNFHGARLNALMAAVGAGLTGATVPLRRWDGRFPELRLSNIKSSAWIAWRYTESSPDFY